MTSFREPLQTKDKDGNVTWRAPQTGQPYNLIDDFSAKGDGVTDDAGAFKRAVAAVAANPSRTRVLIPYTADGYKIDEQVHVSASGMVLQGLGDRPRIFTSATDFHMFLVQDGKRVGFDNLELDGSGRTGFFCVQVFGENANEGTIKNCYIHDGQINVNLVSSVRGWHIHDSYIASANNIGVQCKTSFNNTIENNEFYRNKGFGCNFTGKSANNIFRKNTTEYHELELCVVEASASANLINENYAVSCGADNGISIIGSGNIINSNIVKRCGHNGISISGSRNTVTDNQCYDNAQKAVSTRHSGITIGGAFGGAAEENIISNNICVDTQSVPTQNHGINLFRSRYNQWTTAAAIQSSNPFIQAGSNVYSFSIVATSVLGSVRPTWTSGASSDGSVTLTYVRSSDVNFASVNNIVRGNILSNNKTSDFNYATTALNQTDALVVTTASRPEVSGSAALPLRAWDTNLGIFINNTGGGWTDDQGNVV